MSKSSVAVDSRTGITAGGPFGALKFALPFLGGLVLLVAIPAVLSAWLKLDFDSMYWIAVGLTLAGLTLTRPWWFWYHRRAMLVRVFLGDRGTTVAYLLAAALIVLLGSRRQVSITKARRNCAIALASAQTSHERFRVLYHGGVDDLSHTHYVRQSFICEQLLEP